MSSINVVVVKNDNEEIQRNFSAIKKLKKYDKILMKGNNIFVKIGNNIKSIPLIWNRSFFIICKMAFVNPTEIALFNHYVVDETESENKSVSNTNENERSDIVSKSINTKKFLIPETFKQGILDDLIKKGNLIAKNPILCKRVWRNIYKYLLIFPFIIFIGLVVSLVSFKVKFLSFVEILNYILTIMLSITAYVGIEKSKKNKLQNWKEVNIMIYIMGGITGITILSCLFPGLAGSIAIFIYAYRFYIFLFYLILATTLFTCYFLNVEMNVFYSKYYEEEQAGKLLDDVFEE